MNHKHQTLPTVYTVLAEISKVSIIAVLLRVKQIVW